MHKRIVNRMFSGSESSRENKIETESTEQRSIIYEAEVVYILNNMLNKTSHTRSHSLEFLYTHLKI